MRTRLVAILAVVGLLALVVAGAYAIGYRVNLATDSVAAPSASTSPDQVVRTYVQAFNQRDRRTMDAIYPSGHQFNRFRAMGTMRDLQITSSKPMSDGYRHGGATEGHRDGYAVGIQLNFTDLDPDLAAIQGNTGWTYFLVRDADDQPWTIVDHGNA
jgi:hypothetical protein